MKKMMTSIKNVYWRGMTMQDEVSKNKHVSLGTSLATCGMMLMTNRALADDPAAELFKLFIDIVGGIIIVIGVILAVVGLVSMALAYSDADGPAKKKAGMEIAAGVGLCLLSATLTNDTMKNSFTNIITSNKK